MGPQESDEIGEVPAEGRPRVAQLHVLSPEAEDEDDPGEVFGRRARRGAQDPKGGCAVEDTRHTWLFHLSPGKLAAANSARTRGEANFACDHLSVWHDGGGNFPWENEFPGG